MKNLILITLLFAIAFQNSDCQKFVSDSITYRYNGEMSPEREQSFLSQFGLKDQKTNSTEINRDGDNIWVSTQLKQEWRVKVMSIVIQNRCAIQDKVTEDSTLYTEQTIVGLASLGVYNKTTEYFSVQHTSGAPYVTIIWQEFDLDEDKQTDRMQFHLINSRDIIQSIYCHPK